MIIWLASYPKSGNTLVRSMLSAYYFSQDGNYNFQLIKNIKQFPHGGLFLKMGIDINNHNETVKNYIKVQESFNIKKSIQFLKTHSYLFNIENQPFTNLDNSLGVIYAVRDPRNVVLSSSGHNSKTHEKSTEDLIKGRILVETKKEQVIVYPGTWSGNFNSWKSFKAVNKYFLIKYEDLVRDKEKSFYEILNFIHKLKKVDFTLDKEKFQNTLDSTAFEVMQKMESEKGFKESMVDKNTGKKIKFFNLGPNNDWKKLLDVNLKKEIENNFEKEMIELGYL